MNKLRIKKLGVLSVAKMYAAIALVVSLLISIPYGLFIIIFSVIGAAGSRGETAGLMVGGGGIIVGVLVMIGLPIMYSLMAFVGGALGAVFYNVFARFVGGIEIEVENFA